MRQNFCGKSEIFDFVDEPTSRRLELSKTLVKESSDVNDAESLAPYHYYPKHLVRVQMSRTRSTSFLYFLFRNLYSFIFDQQNLIRSTIPMGFPASSSSQP